MSYVPPTLEGRVLVDLGQQLTAMRARAEQAEADNARLLEALGTYGDHISFCATREYAGKECDCGYAQIEAERGTPERTA